MKTHKYAELFPLLPQDKLQKLADDIAANAQQLPIILDQDGRLVDGRNRLAACKLAGKEPVFETRHFEDERAVLKAVTSLNDVRRHLTESQRAMIAAEIANMQSGGQRGNTNASKNESLNLDSRLSEKEQSPISMAEAADQLNVSRASVGHARKVIKDGIPELRQAVKVGTLSVSAAAKTATKSPDVQRKKVEQLLQDQGEKAHLNGAAHTTEQKPEKSKEGDSLPRLLRWASKRKKISDKDARDHLHPNDPSKSAETPRRMLEHAAQSVGYLVEALGNKEFIVRKAVHFVWAGDAKEHAEFKDMMKELYELAKEAYRIDGGHTSAEWNRKNRTDFLMKVMNITGPLAE